MEGYFGQWIPADNGSNGLGIKGSKNLKGPRNLKRPTFSFGSKNGRDVECSNPSSKNRLGYLVQEESGGDSRRGYSTDLCSTDRDLGLVRGRTGPSMEATVPHNSNEHHNWGSAIGPQCVEPHAQPVA